MGFLLQEILQEEEESSRVREGSARDAYYFFMHTREGYRRLEQFVVICLQRFLCRSLLLSLGLQLLFRLPA